MSHPNLVVSKEASSSYVALGDTVEYKLIFKNEGSISLYDISVTDLLSANLAFINGSVKLDFIDLPNQSILSGINIGSLAPNRTKILTFKAKVVNVPDNGNNITTLTTVQFNYKDTCSNREYIDRINLDPFIICVFNPKLTIETCFENKQISINDIIDFEILLKSDGNIDLFNILLKSTLDGLTEIVDGSFTIDGVRINNVNLKEGLNIGTIHSGKCVTIKYKLKILASTCSNKICGAITANYNYIFPNCKPKVGFDSSKIICLNITLSNFKQMLIEEYLKIPDDNMDIESINTVNTEVQILRYHITDSPSTKSLEGQNINKHKVIIYGLIKYIVEYTSCDCYQSAKSFIYTLPFSAFMVLPINFDRSCNIDLDAEVEYTNAVAIDERTLFASTSILLIAQV